MPLLFQNESPPRDYAANYLGVHFPSYITWWAHIDKVFPKYLKLSSFIRRIRSMDVHRACVSVCISIILHWHFPRAVHQKCYFYSKCLHLVSSSSDVAYAHIYKVIISQQFNSRRRCSSSTLNDPLHPDAFSTFNICSYFNSLRSRSSLYNNPILLRLACLLVNPTLHFDFWYSKLSGEHYFSTYWKSVKTYVRHHSHSSSKITSSTIYCQNPRNDTEHSPWRRGVGENTSWYKYKGLCGSILCPTQLERGSPGSLIPTSNN